MKFNYQAQDKSGKKIRAKIEAESLVDAIVQLKSQGLLPIDVKPSNKAFEDFFSKKSESPGGFKKSIKMSELVVFTRQLSSALSGGLLLNEALETIGLDWHNLYFRQVIVSIVEDIRSGKSLSAAMGKFPAVFSTAYLALVKAGEQSGNMGLLLNNLTRYLEENARLVQKIKSATRYPMFIIGFFCFTVFIVVFFIIPKFKSIFSKVGLELPLITRIVVGGSEFLIKNFGWLILAVVCVIVIYSFLLKDRKIKLFFDRFKLGIPLVGDLLLKSIIARFARTLAILIGSGVGLATSLTISAEAVNNLYLESIIRKIRTRVLSGFSLSQEIGNHNIFQKMFVKMVQVGERTGKISQMLEYNANYYEAELEAAIADFTSLLEPVLIVAIGAVVLIVVLALYLPIFKIAAIK